ncbi:HU family DNA-binding protein [Halomonas sp. N3-2A]|uniref:HU family DNA-binding protein n=1 Tax=Halomonas sp. N3-2A TaxID=2014541 RepID=UPI000B5B4936|nr:HU family DNA-binding protein [Halomonas sp. N3-2A]ASK17887.1 DNA-binding protein HU [Halomonas sp. N3-2A]
MNKKELVDHIAVSADVSKAKATRVSDAFIEAVITTMANGGKLLLIGFGTLETRQRDARIGRNPRTGQVKRPRFHRHLQALY